MFADDVKKLSGGRLEITVHSAQSLIKNPEIKRSIQNGLVPAGEFFVSNLGPENPLFEIDAIPFLATTYPEAAHLWAVTRAPISALFEKQGMRLLYSVPWPSQAFYTKDAVSSLADLKGKKMRTYNAQTARLGDADGHRADHRAGDRDPAGVLGRHHRHDVHLRPDRRHDARLGVHPVLLRHRRLGAEERRPRERGRVPPAAGRRAEGGARGGEDGRGARLEDERGAERRGAEDARQERPARSSR